MLLVIFGSVAGSVGWIARDRATRQTLLDQQMNQALAESTHWHETGNLPETLSAVKRAEGLLTSGGESNSLRQQINQAQTRPGNRTETG